MELELKQEKDEEEYFKALRDWEAIARDPLKSAVGAVCHDPFHLALQTVRNIGVQCLLAQCDYRERDSGSPLSKLTGVF